MAIITKAGDPAKGAATVFTLDKAELALHATVSGDAYFSNQAVWDKVKVYFNSSVGGQIQILTFDASLGSPTADFSVHSSARNIFQVSYLEIIDFQGGKLNVPRVDLAEVDFDVDMTPGFSSKSLQFADDTFISMGNTAQPDPDLASFGSQNGNWAVDFWYKWDGTSLASENILARTYGQGHANAAGGMAQIALNASGEVEIKNNAGAVQMTSTGDNVADGQWHHIIASCSNGTTKKIIIDGLDGAYSSTGSTYLRVENFIYGDQAQISGPKGFIAQSFLFVGNAFTADFQWINLYNGGITIDPNDYANIPERGIILFGDNPSDVEGVSVSNTGYAGLNHAESKPIFGTANLWSSDVP